MTERKGRAGARAGAGRALAIAALIAAGGACGSGGPATSGAGRPESARRIAGMYWARIGDVPDGMRAQVWLDSDGARVRGGYSAVPWNAEIEGRVAGPNAVRLTFLERGVTRSIGTRTREATMRWDARGHVLAGIDGGGDRVELVKVEFGDTALRPGLWLGRWTGLPYGLAVETRIARDPDGHFRAVYQYQGSGGVRQGSFDGELDPAGVLTIRWTEVTETGELARGRGRLAPAPFGLRGTYGVEGSTEGTGEWALEPFGP